MKSGFLSRDYTWNLTTGNFTKLSYFRLRDNYLRFYLKYIDKNLHSIEQDMFADTSLSSLRGWTSILGLQFENLVLNNRPFIADRLAIKAEDIICNNPYFQQATKRRPGCQIDYLIQTKLDVLYVCEIKFSKAPIKADIIDSVQQKISRLKLPKRYSCKPVLIHANGVHEEVEDQNYFIKIIPFGDVLTK